MVREQSNQQAYTAATLQDTSMAGLAKQIQGCISGTSILGITDTPLIGQKAQQVGENFAWYRKHFAQ